MRAIIPVAGMGTRLRPHTHTQPKALMHVAGKPILAHILDELVGLGITEVVFVVGHLGEKIEGYVSEHYAGLRAHFVPQGEALGNGHAVYVARDFLAAGPAVVVFGDTIVRGDLEGLLSGADALIGVKEVPDPRRLGVVELDSDGYVRRLVEKPERPPSNLAVIGAYFFPDGRPLRAALERLVAEDRRARGEFWLADGLQLMIDAGERMGVFPVEHWYDCGTAEALLEANRDLLDTMAPPAAADGAIVLPPSYVNPAAVVEGSVIGPHVSIAEGAQVVNSVIRDSIINAHAQVTDALLEHSLVGEHAVVRGRPGRINVGESSELELR